MKIKKFAALVMGAALLFTAACGTEEGPAVEGPPAQGYAMFEPETVVFTAGGLDVTWDLWYYFLASAAEEITLMLGAPPDWNETEEGLSYRGWAESRALYNLLSYKAIEYTARERGVALTDEDRAAMQLSREQAVLSAGGEEAFEAALRGAFIMSDPVYEYLVSTQQLLDNILIAEYGAGGALVSDEMAVAVADDIGWDWLMAKHILLSTRRDGGDGTSVPRGDEEAAAVLALAEELIERLDRYEGGDFDGFFDELAREYSDDTRGLALNPDGYLFTSGDMVPEFEREVRALEIGQYSSAPVAVDYGYHIIYRLPVNYDIRPETRGVDSTIRELAANELLINSMESLKSEIEIVYTPAYEGFDIATAFPGA